MNYIRKIPFKFLPEGCLFIFLIQLILFIPHSLASTKTVERKGLTPVGEIIFVAGRADIRLVPEDNYRPAVPKQELVEGDIIRTGPGGRLSILLRDETQIKIASNSTLIIKEVTPHKEKTGVLKTFLKLESGEVWTRSKGVPDGLTIETPYATAAIRGTEWSLSVKEDRSSLIVMEGNVHLSNQFGSITVGKNEQATVIGGEAPVKSIIIRPRDRIQWTYYLTEKRLLGHLKFSKQTHQQAEALFNEGRFEESAGAFEDILSKKPNNHIAITGLGLIELKKGYLEKAAEYLDKALRIKKDLLALLGKSYILISNNMTDEAKEVLKDARESFPTSPLPYIFSSYLYAFHGDFQEALDECSRGLSSIPNDPLILTLKADIYFILDRPGDAKTAIEALLKENPESSEGYERAGVYHRVVTGDSKKAREAFKNSISLDPLNDNSKAKLAELLREEGFIPEALELIKNAISIASWNAMHHYNYGRLLADINRIDEARDEFMKSLELDLTFSRAYLGEGIVLLKEGKTDEALRELSKASLFEPNLSEIHVFLAIAYYQKHNVSAALDELKRAEECDPLDSTPHQLASTIYNDLYMPVKAIEEARKVLELLPYRKASGEALLESTKSGTMSVNYGLNFLDLPEWSLYYAQKALFANPYSNESHLGVAIAYGKLGEISALQGYNEFATPYFSEVLQGLTLNVNSLNYSNRYSTLISKPGHYLTVGSIYSQGDSEMKKTDLTASGNFGSRFPLTYWFQSNIYNDSGYLENSKARSADAGIGLGYKPAYDHDIYLELFYNKKKEGVTPDSSFWYWQPDDNQEYRDNYYWVELGYHKRFSPVSHLITLLRYSKDNDNLENPDYEGDFVGFANMRSKYQNFAFGIRHMLTLHESHQFSYGFDYGLVKINSAGEWPYYYPIGVSDRSYTYITRSTVFHIYDRWTISPKITLDAGLFLTNYNSKDELRSMDTVYYTDYHILYYGNKFNLNPRLGVAVNIGKNGVFRIAFQRRSTTGFVGELAPVGTSGLIPPTFDIYFNAAQDIQGSIEYELSRKTFAKALIGYEKLSDLITTGGNKRAQLWYSRFAINQILSDNFSFSVRYHYNDSRYLDGSGRKLHGIPQNSGDARLVFVHPDEIYLWLRESYTGGRFFDSGNTTRLRGYFLTDFYAQKEILKKRVLLSFSVSNIFNAKYETVAHWYDNVLQGRGTTLFFRIEYRL